MSTIELALARLARTAEAIEAARRAATEGRSGAAEAAARAAQDRLDEAMYYLARANDEATKAARIFAAPQREWV